MKAANIGLIGALLLAWVLAGCSSEPSPTAAPLPARLPAAGSPVFSGPVGAPTSPSAEPGILTVLTVEREVDLLAERDGTVVELLREEGEPVAAGEVLARLDDRELHARLDRARADLVVAQNNVKYNEAELKARQAAYRREQELNELGLNSQAALEEAEFRATGAQYDLESWRAIVDRTQADIRILEVELEKTRLRAPFSGVVARRYLRVGQNIRKDEKCFRVSQLQPLQVHFLVPEAARRPRPEEIVELTPVADSRRVYSARVLRVSPTVDAASGSYDATAQLIGTDMTDLRPGMAVRVLYPITPATSGQPNE